ncbi:MAG: hypothetical protein OEW99_12970 [Gammaproteobacteria bacterium]|nr:hypothetical protein [Gammaproteobacteria bacterium]
MGSTVLARNIAAALEFVIFGLIATNTLWQINPHPNPADSCATIRINEYPFSEHIFPVLPQGFTEREKNDVIN